MKLLLAETRLDSPPQIQPVTGSDSGTEEGVATDLLEAGVPKAHIVLGFRHPCERKYSGLVVA